MPESSEKELAVLSIATNGYLIYYESLLESYKRKAENISSIEFHIFTDDIVEARRILIKFSEISLVIHEIESYKWPEATLLRYRIYKNELDSINAKYLMHLDSDMLFKEDIERRFNEMFFSNGMSLVKHPGFYRENNLKIVERVLCHPKRTIADFFNRVKMGGLGSWETNRKSTAYVRRSKRRTYYCGGAWIGEKSSFKQFIVTNAANVDRDLERGYIAKWHDESHLNHWATMNTFKELKPNYCFDATYPNLKKLCPVIEAVNKSLSDPSWGRK